MLAHAQRVEQEALAIERRLAAHEQRLDGLLRITSSEWFGTTVLAPVLCEFARLHPGVTLELLTDARFLNLARRDADLAFRIRPFEQPDIMSRKLLQTRYGVYAKRGSKRPQAGDGAGSNLIAMDTGFAGIPDDSWLQAQLPNSRVVFRSNSRDVQARMCAQGVGLAVLPKPLAERMAGLVAIDLGGEPPPRPTWVGYHRDLRKLKRLRALLDLVIERLADNVFAGA